MRKPSFLLAALLYGAIVLAQQPNDHSPYTRTLTSFSKWYAADASDSIYTLFSDVLRSKLPADTWRGVFPQIRLGLGDLGAFTLDATGEGYTNYVAFGSVDSTGLILSMDTSFRIQGLFRKKGTGKPTSHTNYKVHTPEGDLAGELVMPFHNRGHKEPVVLIIAGSGPTDRDGNSSEHGLVTNAYAELAQDLSMLDIASLRYDKRFVGESADFKEHPDSLCFEDYVNDARACIRQLKADKIFSSVIVVGHSEGALIGAIAAREEQADGFVSLAGAGVPAEVIMKRQLMRMGLDEAKAEKILDSLVRSGGRYISSWNKYDPAQEIAKLQMPIAIIQGLRDIQVDKEDAKKLEAAAPRAWLVYMDSMNHVLKWAPADRAGNLAIYNSPGARLYSELVPTIQAFIRQPEREAKGCVYSKWLYTKKKMDDGHFKFIKPAADSLMIRLQRCNEDLSYPSNYKDAAFEITVPAYLSRVTYENGNNDFAICLYDSLYQRAVIIRYDFAGKMTPSNARADGKATIKGKQMFFYMNLGDKMVGQIYQDHNIVVSYYIPDRTSEKDMQEAITSFTFTSGSPVSR